MAARGLILFGHGARDARWAEPMRQVRERVAIRAPGVPVELAFLEIMRPDLPTAVAALRAAGCTAVSIVPLFLGQGPHVRKDLAALVERARGGHPELDIECSPAVGEDATVLDAIAAFALTALAKPPRAAN